MNEEIYKYYSESLEFLRKENIELKNSRAYRIGVKVDGLYNAIKTKRIFKFLKTEKDYKSLKKYSCTQSITKDNFDYGQYPHNKKFVIYTCITGNYDNINEPLFFHPDISYVGFTDNFESNKFSEWEIRPIDENIKHLSNNILINRYYKFHPFTLFPDADYSIYIDGNMRVISDLRNMINRINQKTGLAFHRHGARNCIYKEAEACRITGKGNYQKILEQVIQYKKEGFPQNFGLYEANVIVSDLNNNNAKVILDKWWDEFCKTSSYRDQIALPYVVWKSGFKFDDIGNLGINVNNNPKLEKVNHL